MANAFTPHDDCPVPSVEAITGDLVSSCEIKTPIDPIFEFPLDFPLPTPTNFNVGCWSLPEPSVDFGPAGSVAGGSIVAPSFGVHVRYPNRSETGFCEPVLDFYIRLPAGNCPTVDASAQAQMTWEPQGTVEVTAERQGSDEAECGFDFNFDFKLPCVRFTLNPSFDLGYDETMSSLWAHITLNSSISSWQSDTVWSSAPGTDECLYDFTLGMVLPPPFCDITTELIKNVDPTVYEWCDAPPATYVSKIDSLEFEVPAGPGDPYNVILTYTTSPPWSGVVFVHDYQGEAYPCYGDCCMTIPVITNIVADEGGPDCDSQTTLNFSIDTVTLQWYQEITLNPEPSVAPCCEHFTVLTPPVVATTGCGGEFHVSTQEVWIPHDAWTIPEREADEFYSGGTFDGQPSRVQLVTDIHQSEREECDCANGFTVDFDWYRPFPQGGYSGDVYVGIYVLRFEYGLLTSVEVSGVI